MADYSKILSDNKVTLNQVTRNSAEWFNALIKDMAKIGATPTRLMKSDNGKFVNRPDIGKMYAFFYWAKNKETLPYWDRYPMVFPFRAHIDGFTGLNFHYLPPQARIQLLSDLTELNDRVKLDKYARLQLSYAAIQNVASQKLYEPAIHRYLYKQMQSSFFEIAAPLWTTALTLPVERFTSWNGVINKRNVWARSGF